MKQRVSENFMYIHNLEERIPYTFSVRAQTIDYGPPAIGNVTTGPRALSGKDCDSDNAQTEDDQRVHCRLKFLYSQFSHTFQD